MKQFLVLFTAFVAYVAAIVFVEPAHAELPLHFDHGYTLKWKLDGCGYRYCSRQSY
jgi:hypothetical protein